MNAPPDEHASFLTNFFDRWNQYFPTGGNLSLAALWVAVISGLGLALAFDPAKAYDSLQILLLDNPGGALLRGVHYWSGQFLLIFCALHVVERLSFGSERQVSKGIWLRVSISAVMLLFIMASGFMLKGDKEGLLARQVLNGLIGTVPLVHKTLQYAILGPENVSHIIYLHHAVTGTLLVLVAGIEHGRRIWPEWRAWVYVLSFSTIAAHFKAPGLHDSMSPVVKGPWYMLGLQEILHWTSHPLWVLMGIIVVFLLLMALPYLPERYCRGVKFGMAGILMAYLCLVVVGWLLRGADWQWVSPW